MKPLTQEEILASFDPVDRPQVVEPDLSGCEWDALDYLGWKEPNGHKGYLCVPLQDRIYGLILRFGAPGGGSRGGMCDLCYCVPREEGTRLVLVESWSRPRTSYGINICADLSCSAAVRGQNEAGHMGETLNVGHRIERLQLNLERFVRKVSRRDSRQGA